MYRTTFVGVFDIIYVGELFVDPYVNASFAIGGLGGECEVVFRGGLS